MGSRAFPKLSKRSIQDPDPALHRPPCARLAALRILEGEEGRSPRPACDLPGTEPGGGPFTTGPRRSTPCPWSSMDGCRCGEEVVDAETLTGPIVIGTPDQEQCHPRDGEAYVGFPHHDYSCCDYITAS